MKLPWTEYGAPGSFVSARQFFWLFLGCQETNRIFFTIFKNCYLFVYKFTSNNCWEKGQFTWSVFTLVEPIPPLDFWDKLHNRYCQTTSPFISKVERWGGFSKCKTLQVNCPFFPAIIWCEFVNKQTTVFDDHKKIPLANSSKQIIVYFYCIWHLLLFT